MTNTLHRYGSGESFSDDYIVFAIPARGFNDNGAVEKLRQFLEIARKYKPVNMGDASHGSIFRPSKELNPTVHWRRDLSRDFDSVVSSVSCTTTVAAVFDNQDQAVAFIQELKEADLGLSINISTALDKAQQLAIQGQCFPFGAQGLLQYGRHVVLVRIQKRTYSEGWV